MPPNHSKSTLLRRIAEISDSGSISVAATASIACTCGDNGIDFIERGNTPPPSEIIALS